MVVSVRNYRVIDYYIELFLHRAVHAVNNMAEVSSREEVVISFSDGIS